MIMIKIKLKSNRLMLISLMYMWVYLYLMIRLISYHPSDSYFTPPWGVSTNQGKDIRAYVNGFDFYFSSVKGRESVKSPLRHCDSPIKLPDFVFSWSCVGEKNISLCNESLSCIFISLVGPRSSNFYFYESAYAMISLEVDLMLVVVKINL